MRWLASWTGPTLYYRRIIDHCYQLYILCICVPAQVLVFFGSALLPLQHSLISFSLSNLPKKSSLEVSREYLQAYAAFFPLCLLESLISSVNVFQFSNLSKRYEPGARISLEYADQRSAGCKYELLSLRPTQSTMWNNGELHLFLSTWHRPISYLR